MSSEGKFGHQYFDNPIFEGDEDQEPEEDLFDIRSCEASCCDEGCECDDCLRCSNQGLVGEDQEDYSFAAA